MSDLSASGSEKEDEPGVQIPRTFAIPNQTAGVPELREALKNSHKLVHELVAENKLLRAQIAKYKASNPGRKGKKGRSSIKGDNMLGYHTKIISLGKSFGVMVDPWIQTMVFSKKIALPLATPAQIFKSESELYNQYLTAALYTHVDEKFHELIDTAFLHHLNAQRSTGIHNIKECLPLILLSEKVVTDLEPATIRRLILHPGDDPKAQKCSKFPPILYHGLRQLPTNLFMNRIPALALRAVLWGKESVSDGGTRKPASSVVGHIWKIKKVTEGSIAFVCTAMMGPGFQRVLKFWHSVVFASITVAAPVERAENAAEANSDEEMAEALAGLDIEGIPEDDANRLSNFNWESDDESPVAGPSNTITADPPAPSASGEGSEAEEPARRPRRADGARDPAPSVPTTEEEEVDEIPAPVGRVHPRRIISPVEEEEGSDLTALSNEDVAPAAVGGRTKSSKAAAPNPPATVSGKEPARKGKKASVSKGKEKAVTQPEVVMQPVDDEGLPKSEGVDTATIVRLTKFHELNEYFLTMPSGVGSPPPSPSSSSSSEGKIAAKDAAHECKCKRQRSYPWCSISFEDMRTSSGVSHRSSTRRKGPLQLPARGAGQHLCAADHVQVQGGVGRYDLGKVDTEVDALPRMPMAPMQPNIAMQAKRQLAMLQDMIAEVKTVRADLQGKAKHHRHAKQELRHTDRDVRPAGYARPPFDYVRRHFGQHFTDMAFHDKIKDSQRNVEAVQLNVGVLLPMCTARSERTSGYRSVHGAHSSSCMLTYYELGLGLNHIVRKWTMFVNIGLQNGVLLQTVLDPINGQLTDTRTRFLGTRPIRLLHVQIQQNPAILALSSRSWLNYMHQNLMHFTPLIFENFRFSAELSPEGLIRITGSTLRIFQIPKLGTKLKQDSMPLSYTPRKFIAHPTNHYFYMIEGDHHVLGPDAAAAKLDGLSLKIKYFDTVPVMSSLCILKSGFLFVAAEFGNHYVYRFQKLGNDDNEPEYSSTTYPSFSMSDPSSLLPHAYFRPRALENLVIADEIESIDPIIDSKVLNVLRYSDAQQIFTACRREAWSTFRTRHRLEVEESFGRQSGGKTQDDEYDSYIILSFANGTLVLSIGETIEEVQDTASTVPFQGAPELVDANRVEWQQHGL
ncbi:hypothetical protein B0H17DRAFT_1141427 [Mycena rosella]|uniref:Uncharacterized protein n=1 Tax=Mycena rosella TaxID=1033263 RepID=A0AAD7CZP9_MYCRO|nr:hypothetical protein B0H17DRAFT_1141427 [Mycena rosella]